MLSNSQNFICMLMIFICDRNVASESKKSRGGVLIADKQDFDVHEVSTRHGLIVEHVCVRVMCNGFLFD
jgi:hypothetical protein